MPDQDPKINAQLRALLAPVPGLEARWDELAQRSLGQGSRAAIDRSNDLGKYILHLVAQGTGVASDHLHVWYFLININAGIQPCWAHGTLIRSVLEQVVLVRWLLDPRVNSTERVQRGIAAQLEDYAERRKFEEAWKIGQRPSPAKTAAQRDADLRKRCADANIAIPKKPQKMVATDLFRDFGVPDSGVGYCDDRKIYRLVSGFAHGKQWTLLVSSKTESPSAAVDHLGTRRGLVTADDTISVAMTEHAIRYFATALDELEEYIGR